MSNIHGKHVHSVKTWRNLIWGIVFSANTASVMDVFEIIALVHICKQQDSLIKSDVFEISNKVKDK